jgi:anti-anti-sigma factor
MPGSISHWFDVSEIENAVVVRFVDPKILNDQKMETIAEELYRLADKLGKRDLRLDFVRVDYVQSSVLGKLVALHKRVTGMGNRLILCNIRPAVYTIFTVTRLAKLFTIEGEPLSDENAPA